MLDDELHLGELAASAREDNVGVDDAYALFLDWNRRRGTNLWPHQDDACLALALGDHVILGTPTGSGKSTVALWLAFLALCTGKRMYYTAPIKALVSEKFFDFSNLLGRENVGMLTGDVALNGDAPIICCTEEILANDALRFGDDGEVAFAALDEFHFFGDPQRGWAWQVPIIVLKSVQFLLMSATLGDTPSIAAKIEERSGRQVTTIDDAPRPVPLEYEFCDSSGLEGTVELALGRDQAPLYIVHFAQDAAHKSAQSLASFGVSSKEQREAIKESIRGVRFTTAFGKTLKRLILMGVGVHHAGMLPRYRRTVERLAQAGLLPVICGTDTLGVGINVPIRTVVMTALAKFDGSRERRLNAREFHQIAGRAGRSGFDEKGTVIVQATIYDIERNRALAKAGGDPKRARKIKTAKPPDGFVGWNKQTFERLVATKPEPLRPRMQVTHAMVLAEVMQGGDAWARMHDLIETSMQTEEQKERLSQRADEVFATLEAAGMIGREELGDGEEWFLEEEMPDRFALDQPLSPFLLASLELLDREDPMYALNVISMVEATLEDPRQILRAQERAARDAAMAAMKAEGVEYEERMERLREVTYPKPLDELLAGAFELYCLDVPWASDFRLSPKSVLRDMVETASDFKTYIQRYGLARCEGILLRYLADAYRVLDRTIPPDFFDERLDDIVCWLGWLVRAIDSSLFDEWAGIEYSDDVDAAAPADPDVVVADRRAVTLLVRNALFARVRLAALNRADELGSLDAEWDWPEARWRQVLDDFYADHEELLVDAAARSARYFQIDESAERTERVWHVRQILLDADEDLDYRIEADVDLDATQNQGEAVFKEYRVGSVEDLGLGVLR